MRIWFWQPRRDGFGVVGYLGASGLDADDWIDILRKHLAVKGFKLGIIHLPHDAAAKTFVGHPHLQIPQATIEIMELNQMPA